MHASSLRAAEMANSLLTQQALHGQEAPLAGREKRTGRGVASYGLQLRIGK
jgi:hypothetical protein